MPSFTSSQFVFAKSLIDFCVDEGWRIGSPSLVGNGYCSEHIGTNDTCQCVRGHVDVDVRNSFCDRHPEDYVEPPLGCFREGESL